VGQDSIHAVIDTLYIHVKHPIPIFLPEHTEKTGFANAGIADKKIHILQGLKGGSNRISLGNVAANGRGAGFGGNPGGSGVVFFV
jgi:hypothetical protein